MMRRERAELRMTSEIARTVIPGNKRIESAVIAGNPFLAKNDGPAGHKRVYARLRRASARG